MKSFSVPSRAAAASWGTGVVTSFHVPGTASENPPVGTVQDDQLRR